MARVRYIDLPAHLRRDIREKFGVSEGAVSLALNFRRNDGVSKEIQDYALGLPGATLMYRVPANEMLHKSDKGFKQVFANGWSVVSDIETGETQVFTPNGTLKSRCYDTQVAELHKVLEQTQAQQ